MPSTQWLFKKKGLEWSLVKDRQYLSDEELNQVKIYYIRGTFASWSAASVLLLFFIARKRS